jgi:hypothetical protein
VSSIREHLVLELLSAAREHTLREAPPVSGQARKRAVVRAFLERAPGRIEQGQLVGCAPDPSPVPWSPPGPLVAGLSPDIGLGLR